MARNTSHPLQPETDHDGLSRRMAVLALKRSIRSALETRMKQDFQQNVLGQSELSPQTGAEVAAAMEQRPSYQLWATVNRAAQDRMWSLLSSQIDQDYSRISRQAEQMKRSAIGSIELGDDESIPGDRKRANIHGQPGGYLLERVRGADQVLLTTTEPSLLPDEYLQGAAEWRCRRRRGRSW